LLQRLLLRGQPRRGPQAPREGDPRGDPERGLAGLDRRRLSGDRAEVSNRWLHLALRLGLGGFFLYASLDKIAAPAAFARIVYQWQVVGPVPANLVAVILPWVEALAGLLLVAGLWKREAAAAIAMLLVGVLMA